MVRGQIYKVYQNKLFETIKKVRQNHFQAKLLRIRKNISPLKSQYLQLQSILYLMSGSFSTSQASNRSQRMANLRLSIKEQTNVGAKTLQLNAKLQNMRRISLNELGGIPALTSCPSFDSSLLELDAQDNNSFLDKYDLLEKLGEGGNACVFKCQFKKTQKIYAVKRFRLEEENVLELKKSYINLKQLDHPSIVKYRALHIDQDQHCAFLVMDYVPYKCLADCQIKDEDELRFIIKELLAGISYFHNKNICHRDIKPQNILYGQEEKSIKIIDFGISKKTYQRGGRRDMLTIIGTQFYLAPEIYIGGGYDERVDLWALGVTIYKMVTGYTPFQSEYHSDTISNILKGTFSFDDLIWLKYSPFLKDFISHFLKGKQQRLTISQAEKHLWLQEIKKKSRLSKYVSQNIDLSEDFRHEIHLKMRNASSKEEGHHQRWQKLYKSINIIGVQDYDLQDSDDESTVVSPLAHSLTLNRKTFTDFQIQLKQI